MAVQLLDYYQAIEDASRKMLEAAQIQDWDGVMKFEGTCAILIAQLRHRSKFQELPQDQRAEKARIMRRILHNDAQIRTLTEPWLQSIEHIFEAQAPMVH